MNKNQLHRVFFFVISLGVLVSILSFSSIDATIQQLDSSLAYQVEYETEAYDQTDELSIVNTIVKDDLIINSSKEVQVEIYDRQGSLIQFDLVAPSFNKVRVSLVDLNPAVYYYRMVNVDSMIQGRIVKN